MVAVTRLVLPIKAETQGWDGQGSDYTSVRDKKWWYNQWSNSHYFFTKPREINAFCCCVLKRHAEPRLMIVHCSPKVTLWKVFLMPSNVPRLQFWWLFFQWLRKITLQLITYASDTVGKCGSRVIEEGQVQCQNMSSKMVVEIDLCEYLGITRPICTPL